MSGPRSPPLPSSPWQAAHVLAKICLPAGLFLLPAALSVCCPRNPRGTHACPISASIIKNRSESRAIGLFSFHCDRGYLDARIVDQARYLHGCASRLGIGHDGLVGHVHLREIMNVSQVHGDRNNVFQIETGSMYDIGNATQGCLTFCPDSTGHKFAVGINAFLSSDVERLSRDHSITEGKIGRSGELHNFSFFS